MIVTSTRPMRIHLHVFEISFTALIPIFKALIKELMTLKKEKKSIRKLQKIKTILRDSLVVLNESVGTDICTIVEMHGVFCDFIIDQLSTKEFDDGRQTAPTNRVTIKVISCTF